MASKSLFSKCREGAACGIQEKRLCEFLRVCKPVSASVVAGLGEGQLGRRALAFARRGGGARVGE